MKKRHEQKLVVITAFLVAAFNLPLLLIFDKDEAIWGVPVMYVYIFSIWLITTLLSLIIITKYNE